MKKLVSKRTTGKGPCIGEKMGMNERPPMAVVVVKNGAKRTRGK